VLLSAAVGDFVGTPSGFATAGRNGPLSNNAVSQSLSETANFQVDDSESISAVALRLLAVEG
jgi:hypothetical protein